MRLEIDIQRDEADGAPDDAQLQRAAEAALAAADAGDTARELSLRIVGRREMRALNGHYRARDYATNVLSFPAELPPGLELPLLGDVVICAPVVDDEAREQGKAREAHWDHMLIHGVLHLLGYDHEAETEAQVMEALERRALAALGWPDPYARSTADACV